MNNLREMHTNWKYLKILLFLVIVINWVGVSGQRPFHISLEEVEIPKLGGLHSYAYGQYNDKWLLVGGRLDGLHQRQSWASFDNAGHNNKFIVVDPDSLQQWSVTLDSLPVSVSEQLSSTNMSFYQEGDFLYCIGGYGFSSTEDDHITFPYLTTIDVPKVIDAIIEGKDYSSYIRQFQDSEFQVAGGRIRKINDVFHLLGGQKFIGRYNPMGHPSFTQEYTNQIRRFTIDKNGMELQIKHLTPFTDTTHLHRRDLNAEPQILPDGSEGITMFSGVFQKTADLPFLNSVTVDSNDYLVNKDFKQVYNHYHCASIPIYSSEKNEMHTVFFGGIAQYYHDSTGTFLQDDEVPFVKTIARVTRDSEGKLKEYKLPIEMPAYLGAGSEFIPVKSVPHYQNGVLKLDEIKEGSSVIGFIYGGIQSSQENIFWVNDGSQSTSNSRIFKVLLTK